MTISGRSLAKKSLTADWSRRSSSREMRVIKCWKPSRSSLRRIAEPTKPRWPARYMRVVGDTTRAALASSSATCDSPECNLMYGFSQRQFLLCHLEVMGNHTFDQFIDADLRL